MKRLPIFLLSLFLTTSALANPVAKVKFKIRSNLDTALRRCMSIVDRKFGLDNLQKFIRPVRSIDAKNAQDLFLMQADRPENRWAKGIVFLDEMKRYHVLFWRTGDTWGLPTHLGHRYFLAKMRERQKHTERSRSEIFDFPDEDEFDMPHVHRTNREKMEITDKELLNTFGFQLTARLEEGGKLKITSIDLSSNLDQELANRRLPLSPEVAFNAIRTVYDAIDPKIRDVKQFSIPRLEELHIDRSKLVNLLHSLDPNARIATLKDSAAPGPKK